MVRLMYTVICDGSVNKRGPQWRAKTTLAFFFFFTYLFIFGSIAVLLQLIYVLHTAVHLSY